VRAFTLWGTTETEERETHAAMATGLENGTLRPVVGKEFPLAQAAQAHTDIMVPGAFGKIVLIP
jgi:NADPH2:quinone reductase